VPSHEHLQALMQGEHDFGNMRAGRFQLTIRLFRLEAGNHADAEV
jgi:hypothetical protein